MSTSVEEVQDTVKEKPSHGTQETTGSATNDNGAEIKNDHSPTLAASVQQSPSSLARVKRSPGSYQHRPGVLILNKYEFTIESGKHFAGSALKLSNSDFKPTGSNAGLRKGSVSR